MLLSTLENTPGKLHLLHPGAGGGEGGEPLV